MRTFPYEGGRYTRVDGSDGSGKSTQLSLAQEYSDANDLGAVFVREPGGTEFGVEVRHLILHNRSFHLDPMTEALLFTADRAYLMNTVIKPALDKGFPVISDRGIESSMAYQSAAGGVPAETMLQLGKLALPRRYMEPDGVAILYLPASVRRARMQDKVEKGLIDKIEERDNEFFARVDEGYLALKELPYVKLIDADRPPEDIFNDLRPIFFGPEHA